MYSVGYVPKLHRGYLLGEISTECFGKVRYVASIPFTVFSHSGMWFGMVPVPDTLWYVRYPFQQRHGYDTGIYPNSDTRLKYWPVFARFDFRLVPLLLLSMLPPPSPPPTRLGWLRMCAVCVPLLSRSDLGDDSYLVRVHHCCAALYFSGRPRGALSAYCSVRLGSERIGCVLVLCAL